MESVWPPRDPRAGPWQLEAPCPAPSSGCWLCPPSIPTAQAVFKDAALGEPCGVESIRQADVTEPCEGLSINVQDFLEGGCKIFWRVGAEICSSCNSPRQALQSPLASLPCHPPIWSSLSLCSIFPCPLRTGPVWDFTQEAPEVVTQPSGSHVGTPCVESWLCPFLVRRSSISCGSGPSAGTVRQKQPGPPVWSHGVWLWFWGVI